MRACARAALVLMAMSASFGLAGCGSIDDLKDTVSRWFDIGKSPGGRGLFADDLPDAPPMIAPEKTLKREASKASKKKDKPTHRPQTVALPKKPPISDSTDAVRPQGTEAQSPSSQPEPSRLRTLWPEAPPAGTFSR
jgi:hypothetical protein